MRWQRPRFYSAIAGLLVLGAAAASGPAASAAVVIPFDPNGTNGATTFQVGQFDAAPGNALAVNAIANGSVITGTPFRVLYQARIAALRDANNNSIVVPGVGTNGELTIVAQFNEIASGGGGLASFSTNTSQADSFVRIYFDPGNNANDLAGTGFTDGTLIYEGRVLPNGGGGFAVIPVAPQALDQSPDGNQYPGLSSLVGAGGTQLQSSTVSADSNFFLSSLSNLAFNFNTSNVTPFSQVNPAAQMFDGTAAATLGSLGAINGFSGPNFLFQADATASFVPEPSSIALAGLGFACTLAYSRRRAQRKTA